MPPKTDQHATPSQKILNLFSLFLFTGRKYSLTKLSNILACSKQTVLRMTDELSRTHGIKLRDWMEDGQKWYQLESSGRPHVSLSPREIQLLGMCKELVWHLLPKGICEEVEAALNKTTVLLTDMAEKTKALDSICEVSVKGAIDYTPYQTIIEEILIAIREKKICEIVYQSPNRVEARTYQLALIKVLSYRESLYVSGFRVTEKDTPEIVHEMTLAIHRIKGLTVLNRIYNFDVQLEERTEKPIFFGIMEDEPFQVVVKFKPEAAQYVRERKWSEGQTIKEYKDGCVGLAFTAQSEPEVISWVLSFGKQAILVKPKELRKKIIEELKLMAASYG